MSTTRSLSERIEELQRRQAQLHEQERLLKARKSVADRKADAHRKIVIGATVESVLGRQIQEEELPKLFHYLHDQENRGRYFSRAMNENHPTESANEENEDYERSI